VNGLLCVLRGGGDLATGAAWRLTRAGVAVVVTELTDPLTVRRTVALSSAVHDGQVDIEGMRGELAASPQEAAEIARRDPHRLVAVVVHPGLPAVGADIVVDARLAKRNIDTSIDDAPLVIGLGPGFTAGVDCHAVVETMRGHHLGRVSWLGSAASDTGIPDSIGGHASDRVVRAPADGVARWVRRIGDIVEAGTVLGDVGGATVTTPFTGVVRGLIADGTGVSAGLKIGDIDPRCDRSACHEISDKSLAIGGGVLEAVLWWATRRP
jgi:xanthine dehydrogenase accessory factor